MKTMFWPYNVASNRCNIFTIAIDMPAYGE
jgi:hypothetical protein